MKHHTKLAVIFSALTLAAGAALAHDDVTLDKLTAPHGGQLRAAGMYHYELVIAKNATAAADSTVQVYVTDHAQHPIATAGATGTATLLSGAEKTTLTLTPNGDNGMQGTGKYTATPALKAIVSITLLGKPAEQARFRPLVKAEADHAQ